MSVLSVVSTLAIVLGLAGTLPQIAAMVRRRSAAGQSPLGWMLGVTVHALMGYVNLVGYGATTLAVGNAFGGLLAVVALSCTLRLPRDAAAAPAVPDPDELSTGDLSEMLHALAQERERREAARRAGAEAPQPCEERRRPEAQREHVPVPQPLAA